MFIHASLSYHILEHIWIKGKRSVPLLITLWMRSFVLVEACGHDVLLVRSYYCHWLPFYRRCHGERGAGSPIVICVICRHPSHFKHSFRLIFIIWPMCVNERWKYRKAASTFFLLVRQNVIQTLDESSPQNIEVIVIYCFYAVTRETEIKKMHTLFNDKRILKQVKIGKSVI